MTWINIEDQLPENSYSKRILAYGISQCGRCGDNLEVQFCRYYKCEFEFGEYDCPFKATHWMELPKPPEMKS